jgi:hypothetical protein
MPIDLEWVAAYEGVGVETSRQSNIVNLHDSGVKTNKCQLPGDITDLGVENIRLLSDSRLLVSLSRSITKELRCAIRERAGQLIEYANQDICATLFEYREYRTFSCQYGSMLALSFKTIGDFQFADRFYSISTRSHKGQQFKLGRNGKFHIVGSVNKPSRGSFIRFWLANGFDVPEGRPSHIYRKVNPCMKGAVISCAEVVPHKEDFKLNGELKLEGYVFKV